MNETIIIVTIKHSEPLPKDIDLTDVIAGRAYQVLHNKGLSVDTRAVLVEQKKQEWE